MLNNDVVIACILSFICVIIIVLSRLILKQKRLKQLQEIFVVLFILLFVWLFTMIIQIFCLDKYNLNIKFFYNIYYISICFLPVAYLFIAITFEKGNLKWKNKYILLFIIPVLSLILLWSNDFHHLFYKEYSTSLSTEYGPYFYVHSYYTFAIFAIALFMLLKYTIKNAGFFSRQAILVFVGSIIPLSVNILGSFQIIPVSIYATPISMAASMVCFTFAIFKFDFLKIAPIALQRVVDRMSDGYIIINEDMVITDFNKTFLDLFNAQANKIRNMNVSNLLKEFDEADENIKYLTECINKANEQDTTVDFERHFPDYNKYFNIEISSIKNNDTYLGTLILFKDITQHKSDMNTIRDNQDMLVEKERLASLGQMIGGIAHNLKTPIMSISGATEGLSDLITEYDTSIEDPEVTPQDHHEIAHDMRVWIEKVKGHLSYMSDIITAIKGQAVSFEDQTSTDFTIEELIRMVDILMKHELKSALIDLEIDVKVSPQTVVAGNMNSLVQVVNNIISNSIQAYSSQNKTNEKIFLKIESNEDSNLLISIKDNAGGLPEKVKEKLFKEMSTTKGKNGTGLGLFMSYSNIKAHFGGKLTYKTEDGIGTTFFIEIPLIN